MKKIPECAVCYMECDPEIHAATVRIHEWLKEKVSRAGDPILAGPKSKREKP